MIDDDKFLQIKRDAQKELFKIPGVVAVSIGFKYVGGKNTGRPAIVVKVRKKKNRGEVTSSEFIPATIEDVPVDVQEWEEPHPCISKPVDTGKERPLMGGVRIELEFTTDTQVTTQFGTLGFLAKTDGTFAGVPKDGIVGITCQHVVKEFYSTVTPKPTALGHDIGQPTSKDCSRCSNCCYDIFGTVLNAVFHNPADVPGTNIDAAMLSIDSDWTYLAEIKGIGPVKGIRTLQKPSDLNTKVQKRGAITGLTWGTVQDVDQVVNLPGAPINDGDITVKPDPATPVWDNCVADCSVGGPGMQNFAAFGCEGDSGSAVLDAQNRIVGVLKTVGCSGTAHATGIDAVTRALGVAVETATVAGQAKPVPKIVGINAMLDASGFLSRRPVPTIRDGLQAKLEQAQRELLATPAGRELGDIIDKHHREVISLVNRNKKVAAVWQRNGGPQLVGDLATVVESQNRPIPTEVAGKPLSECLRRMQEVLAKYGSARLAEDLHRYGPNLMQFIGLTYPDLLNALKASAGE